MVKGYIHSKESFGTVDGPGVRYVLFMQGCPMRCLYCHNPDTWDTKGGKEIDAQTVIEDFNKNKAFYSNGGITVTGGEPLLQLDFLVELFEMAKEQGIHTCIDTSGITFNPANLSQNEKLCKLLKYTDLVMLDIKHIDSAAHRKLTGFPNENVLEFAKFLDEKNVPLWIRHVVVKGITDDPSYLVKLGEFIGTLKNLRALDVLPYHSMGEVKYKESGIEYPLAGMDSLGLAEAEKAKKFILEGIEKVRKASK